MNKARSTIPEKKKYLNDFIKRRHGLNAITSSIKNIQAYLLYEAYVKMEVLIEQFLKLCEQLRHLRTHSFKI